MCECVMICVHTYKAPLQIRRSSFAKDSFANTYVWMCVELYGTIADVWGSLADVWGSFAMCGALLRVRTRHLCRYICVNVCENTGRYCGDVRALLRMCRALLQTHLCECVVICAHTRVALLHICRSCIHVGVCENTGHRYGSVEALLGSFAGVWGSFPGV